MPKCLNHGTRCSAYTIPILEVFQPTAVLSSARSQFGITYARPSDQDTAVLLNADGLLMLTESNSSLSNIRPSACLH